MLDVPSMEGLGGILAPPPPADSIQAVQAQRMPFRNAGMFEVLVCVVHADALHDCARPLIANGRKRHDFCKGKLLKPDTQCAARRFRGEALAPERTSQAPTNLDAGREGQYAARDRKPCKADELA